MVHILVSNRLIVWLVVLSALAPVSAQTVSGTISGNVADPSGAVLPGAVVTLINEGTKEFRKSRTNDVGDFVFAAVQPGVYTIRLECEGFRIFQRTGNVLTVNEHLSVGRLELSVGAVADAVTVVAQGAAVQTASSENSALLSSRQVEMIGTRGRDVMSLLRLLPGVHSQTEQESPGSDGVGTPIPNIQGTRVGWSTASVDGMPGNDQGNPLSFGSTVNLDAIGEVKILLNNYQAEFGRNSGALISIVTKSGSQEFHGGAYAYKRHEQFNANNFFNNRANLPKPLYRYTTLGATLGGPLYVPKLLNRTKQSLFFFYSLEDWRTRTPQALRRVTVPSEMERTGDFSQTLDLNGKLITIRDPLSGQAFPRNVLPQSRINRNGQAILQVFPQPNSLDRQLTKGTYNYEFQESLETPKRQNLFRVDYRPSTNDAIYVRGSLWEQDIRGYAVPAGSANWGLLRQHYNYTDDGLVVNYTRIINPRIVNEFSIGARRAIEDGGAISQEELERLTRPKAGFSLGQFNPRNNPINLLPQATFGGVSSAAAITYNDRFPIRGVDTQYTVNDGVTFTASTHTVKAGVYLERSLNTEGRRGRGDFTGTFDFGRDVNNPLDSNYAYANAVSGNFRSYTESSSRFVAKGGMWIFDWYVQDTWKPARRLTLDYGIRFGWYTWRKQEDGQIAGFALERYDPSKAPLLYWPTLSAGGRRAVNPVTGELAPAVLIGALVPETGDFLNGMVMGTDTSYPQGFREQRPVLVEPRFGFAYDVTGDGRTAVRGGFGLSHQKIQRGVHVTEALRNPPIQFNPTVYYGNLDTLLSSEGSLFPSSVTGFDRYSKTPAVYNFTLGIQRDLGLSTVVGISYVGALGRHLLWVRNLNTVPYGAHFLRENADPTNPALPLNDNFFRPFPGYASVSYFEPAATHNYNALQLVANRRFVRGVQFGLAYTWSKTMDYNSTDESTVAVYRPVRVWNYGRASFDQTHNFVFNYTWDLPGLGKLWPNRLTRSVFDRWQLSGTTTFASGTPLGVGFSTVDAFDITGGGDGARVIVTGKAQLPHGERTLSRWFDPTVFARPARGDFGNAPKDVFRGPGINNWDIFLFKAFPIRNESRYFQVRWEMYNAFNHTQFAGVDASARFDSAGRQVNGRFGEVTSARAARVMQLALRFNF